MSSSCPQAVKKNNITLKAKMILILFFILCTSTSIVIFQHTVFLYRTYLLNDLFQGE
ncbi:predicted protein [Enterococcus faecium 1,231,501]|nr:predicted protein [Enterococcus faecium 1,231,501]